MYWKTNKSKQLGYLLGTFLGLLWTVRLFGEFVKEAQVDERSEWILNTGQWLSVPFVVIGVYLMISSSKRPLNDA